MEEVEDEVEVGGMVMVICMTHNSQTKNYYALLIWSLRTKGRWMVDSVADGAVEGP